MRSVNHKRSTPIWLLREVVGKTPPLKLRKGQGAAHDKAVDGCNERFMASTSFTGAKKGVVQVWAERDRLLTRMSGAGEVRWGAEPVVHVLPCSNGHFRS